jgi:uncharacterized protein (TIGR02453 family)
MNKFVGFAPEALHFLSDLRNNNNREWFIPRKTKYEEFVKQPMEQLVTEVAAACQRNKLPLFIKEKSPVTRIYRDIRFSADKRPYHTHVGAALYGRSNGVQFGEMYIHIAAPLPDQDPTTSVYPNTSFVAAGFYMPDPAFLQLARTRIAEQPAAWDRVVKALNKKGLELSAESSLKRMPRGFERYANEPSATYLKLTSLIVSRRLSADVITSPALREEIVKFALAVRPLLEFGWSLNYKPQVRREADLA